MKIYTSYFGNVPNIPNDFFLIPICLFVPNWWAGPSFSPFAPTLEIFQNYKNQKNEKLYKQYFYSDVLSKINPATIVDKLKEFIYENYGVSSETNVDKIILLCYETPEKFCHRHIVSNWLNNNLNLGVIEFDRSSSPLDI